jgi:hypothetical protein
MPVFRPARFSRPADLAGTGQLGGSVGAVLAVCRGPDNYVTTFVHKPHG